MTYQFTPRNRNLTNEDIVKMAVDQQMLSPPNPLIGRLAVRNAFDPLTPTQKLYAHYSARYEGNASRCMIAKTHGVRVVGMTLV